MAKLKRTYVIELEIDTELASEGFEKSFSGEFYPNWDINYKGNEQLFIDSALEELKQTFRYSGLSAKVENVEDWVSSKVMSLLGEDSDTISSSSAEKQLATLRFPQSRKI